jgi:hypothetical protein
LAKLLLVEERRLLEKGFIWAPRWLEAASLLVVKPLEVEAKLLDPCLVCVDLVNETSRVKSIMETSLWILE